jgi:hypothetical protein
MKKKFILFLCIYLSSAVLVVGLMLPYYNTAKQAVSDDNSVYIRDETRQAAYDNWLKSDEAIKIQQHNDDLVAEHNKQQQQIWAAAPPSDRPGYIAPPDTPISSINWFPGLDLELPYPQLADINAIAWEKAGGGTSSYTWQKDDWAKLNVDNLILGSYGHMFYEFLIASIAFWIIVIGLLFFLKPKETLRG